MLSHHLILASSSPRRAALLEQIGFAFEVHPSHVDESIEASVTPEDHVRILSERKAREVALHYSDEIILGADTIVVLNEDIINKPASSDDAVHMLRRLSGQKHIVFTGLTLLRAGSEQIVHAVEKTEVWFRQLEPDEIAAYLASGSPLGKPGLDGMREDFGAVFVEKICGCFYNVVGLPLARFYVTYKNFVKGIIDG